MRLTELRIHDFGPFRRYKVSFVKGEGICVLLTGKNNEGKSSIVNALKLVDAATRVLKKARQQIWVDEDVFYKLLQQDTASLLINRMVYNYTDHVARIVATFENKFRITVYVDPKSDIIYANSEGQLPFDLESIFGIIPPLGPLSEDEDIISNSSHLRSSINTSLAPRHLRNHLWQTLSRDEFDTVKEIVKESWSEVELLDYEIDHRRGKVYCYYREEGVDREISWAGQGLQIWFQIITHLVRLRNTSILILDEPEINLHPEKQNELIRTLIGYYGGSIIIATHSVELMNNVSVTHILNVKKKAQGPQLKSAKDRNYLNLVRSEIGSNFNLVASQFEDCDMILFTEDSDDFMILEALAAGFGMSKHSFNIPIHGFLEYRKCVAYKEAYELLIGKSIKYALVLDRDYYPEDFLTEVVKKLGEEEIQVIFTPGKEIENLFLSEAVITQLVPEELRGKWDAVCGQMFNELRDDCYGSFVTLHQKFLEKRIDVKTIIKEFGRSFDECWNNNARRHEIITGKEVVGRLRLFCKLETGQNIPMSRLIRAVISAGETEVKEFVERVYCGRGLGDQVLHY